LKSHHRRIIGVVCAVIMILWFGALANAADAGYFTVKANVRITNGVSIVKFQNDYTFKSPIGFNSTGLFFDGTGAYTAWSSSQLVFYLQNATNTSTPKLVLTVPSKPAYVLNALNNSWSSNVLTIFGQQANKTVTVVFSTLGTTGIRLYYSTAIMAQAPTYDSSLHKLTIVTSSAGTIKLSNMEGKPNTVTLDSVNKPEGNGWTWDDPNAQLTLTGGSTWEILWQASENPPPVGPSSSSSTWSLIVQVKDTFGNPISGATVSLPGEGKLSDVNGLVDFGRKQAGPYTIHIEATNCKSDDVPINLQGDFTTQNPLPLPLTCTVPQGPSTQQPPSGQPFDIIGWFRNVSFPSPNDIYVWLTTRTLIEYAIVALAVVIIVAFIVYRRIGREEKQKQ